MWHASGTAGIAGRGPGAADGVDPVVDGAGGVGSASPDRAAGRGRRESYRDRRAARGEPQTGITWRQRYESRGLAGLEDEPRSGRPRTVDHDRIITATLTPPPKRLGVTHWSSRLLAAKLGIDHATVARAWKDYGVQPWRSQTFKFSTDPELVAKVTDVVWLYLAPPEDAIVLSIDEKSQIQALDRTAPILP